MWVYLVTTATNKINNKKMELMELLNNSQLLTIELFDCAKLLKGYVRSQNRKATASNRLDWPG